MAVNKNITMKQYTGTDYDTLYPTTTIQQVQGLSDELNSNELPVGTIMESTDPNFPKKMKGTWLPCDGSVIDKTKYPELSSVMQPFYIPTIHDKYFNTEYVTYQYKPEYMTPYYFSGKYFRFFNKGTKIQYSNYIDKEYKVFDVGLDSYTCVSIKEVNGKLVILTLTHFIVINADLSYNIVSINFDNTTFNSFVCDFCIGNTYIILTLRDSVSNSHAFIINYFYIPIFNFSSVSSVNATYIAQDYNQDVYRASSVFWHDNKFIFILNQLNRGTYAVSFNEADISSKSNFASNTYLKRDQSNYITNYTYFIKLGDYVLLVADYYYIFKIEYFTLNECESTSYLLSYAPYSQVNYNPYNMSSVYVDDSQNYNIYLCCSVKQGGNEIIVMKFDTSNLSLTSTELLEITAEKLGVGSISEGACVGVYNVNNNMVYGIRIFDSNVSIYYYSDSYQTIKIPNITVDNAYAFIKASLN